MCRSAQFPLSQWRITRPWSAEDFSVFSLRGAIRRLNLKKKKYAGREMETRCREEPVRLEVTQNAFDEELEKGSIWSMASKTGHHITMIQTQEGIRVWEVLGFGFDSIQMRTDMFNSF